MSISAEMKKKLANANKLFKKTQPASGFSDWANPNVSDGPYKAKLVKAALTEMGDKVAAVFTYEITGGKDEDSIGQEVSNRFFLANEQNIGYFKRELVRFGYDPEAIDLAEDLPTVLEQIQNSNAVVKLLVKTKDENQNVYLNKVLEMDATDDGDDGDDDGDGKASDVADDADGDDAGAAVTKGTAVTFTQNGKKQAGVVTAIDEENETVKVKLNKGGKVVEVALDEITIVEDEE